MIWEQPTSFANHFLIAMPGKVDGCFSNSVSYICEHSTEGAIGIIINRPLQKITLGEVFKQMGIDEEKIDTAHVEQPVMFGGPVQQAKGFVMHADHQSWHCTNQLSEDLSLTTSQDILHALACNEGPKNSLVSLGYAGWGPGQLEHELSQNCWLTGPADPHVLFDLPFEQRWSAATRLLGIDPAHLSTYAGRA